MSTHATEPTMPPPDLAITGLVAPDASEATMRERLRSGDFIIRDAARDSVEQRWGQEWLAWLRAAAVRLADTGVALWDAEGEKWTLTDRQDRLVLSSDGRIIVAAFPGAMSPAEVIERIKAGDFSLSDATAKLVEDRMGPSGAVAASGRVGEMARQGSVAWRGDHANGGWRLAAGGDVALLDAQGRTVYKLFWSALDDRPAIEEDALRASLQAGQVRPGRKLAGRLERAWGPKWHDVYTTRCAELAAVGKVEDHNGTAFKVTSGDLSLLVSVDGQVAVSAHIELVGDPEELLGRIRAGQLTVHPDVDRAADRFRSSTDSVWRHFAACLAKEGIGEIERTGTYWALRYGWVEITISADGQHYTSLTTRNTDDPQAAAERIAAGLWWARPGARKGMTGLPEGWHRSVSVADVVRTPRGWRCVSDGHVMILDHSATLIVASDPTGAKQ